MQFNDGEVLMGADLMPHVGPGVEIELVPCLGDNYSVMMRCTETGKVLVIDAPEAKAIKDALKKKDWQLTDILITHKVDGPLSVSVFHQRQS